MKGIIAILFAVSTIQLWITVRIGRHLARDRQAPMDAHRRSSTTTLALWFLALIITEGYARAKGGVEWDVLFIVHLCFATAALLLFLIAKFWKNGFTSPTAHRWIVYPCCLTYAVALLLGGVLLYRM